MFHEFEQRHGGQGVNLTSDGLDIDITQGRTQFVIIRAESEEAAKERFYQIGGYFDPANPRWTYHGPTGYPQAKGVRLMELSVPLAEDVLRDFAAYHHLQPGRPFATVHRYSTTKQRWRMSCVVWRPEIPVI